MSEATVLSYGGITKEQLERIHALAAPKKPMGMKAAMAAAKGDSSKSGGKLPALIRSVAVAQG